MLVRAFYDNVSAAGNFPEIMQRFRASSQETYKNAAWRRDIPYGSHEREKLCWFSSVKPGAPTFLFIHGGYWQASDKSDYSFIADGLIQLGFNVGLIEYTLAPEANMTRIVAQIGAALDYIHQSRAALNVGNQVILSGHSAGGHLAALHRNHKIVSIAFPISGLTDLEDISQVWLNEKLQLTSEEVERFSPIRHISEGSPMLITVGSKELPHLIEQSKSYWNAFVTRGQDATYLEVPDCHHFQVLDDLAKVDGHQLKALLTRFPGLAA